MKIYTCAFSILRFHIFSCMKYGMLIVCQTCMSFKVLLFMMYHISRCYPNHKTNYNILLFNNMQNFFYDIKILTNILLIQ